MRYFVKILTFMSVQVALFQRGLFQTPTSKGRQKSTDVVITSCNNLASVV